MIISFFPMTCYMFLSVDHLSNAFNMVVKQTLDPHLAYILLSDPKRATLLQSFKHLSHQTYACDLLIYNYI